MKHILSHLVEHGPLTRDLAVEAFDLLMSGQATPAQIGAMLAMISARGPAVDEIVGAATVMRQKLTPVRVPDGLRVVDTCGVGGTASTFFNISTTAAFVTAAVGRPRGVVVAKHGNRSITSACGSADVMEALGVKVRVAGETLTRCLDEAGFCFCFAQAHHPAMKHAAPIRAELGVRTIFNLLGPLTNPAGAQRQLIGVPTKELTQLFANVLNELGAAHAMIVHSTLPDGRPLGEITTFAPTMAHELHHGMIKSMVIDPAELGFAPGVLDGMVVKTAQDSARIMRAVLGGERGPARDVVLLNAAAALVVGDVAKDLPEGLALATEAIDSGAARQSLDKLVAVTQADTSA